ncbi:MAG: hypothetical protein F6K42_01635 [Leptolyngbya sp. SIO1D8]|nr:hypothetical protein [Leptolyngbya sp. SIO1D8]
MCSLNIENGFNFRVQTLNGLHPTHNVEPHPPSQEAVKFCELGGVPRSPVEDQRLEVRSDVVR